MTKYGYLRSSNDFMDRLRIGPGELDLAPLSAPEANSFPLMGNFSNIAGCRVIFYKWADILRVRFDNDPPIDLMSSDVEWTCLGDEVTFSLLQQGRVPIVKHYSLNKWIINLRDGFDPTAFAEPEDFDILLLIRNVRRDPERASRIWRT